jgi:hypothetical protein
VTIQASFDPEGWQRAFDAHVARLYGWSPGTAPLDERLIFYLRLVAETGNLARGKRLVDLGFLPRRVVWVLVTAADKLLRCWPTLCSDIHVVGRRGESVRSNACDC